jgi:hypothetical protein
MTTMSQFETINLNDLPEQTNDFAPIPAGDYTVSIKDAELKPTKDGSGQYIKLKLQVQAPAHVGRVIFSNLNIRNKSQAAETIGRQQLGAIMRALGLASVSDTDQLIGATIGVKVAIKEAQNGYEAQNEVKAYKALTGSVPSPASAAQAPAAATGKAAPPWLKKQ